ncbi:MAG: glycerate kinase type-2 family protein [Candidatus Heimdallarchaeaceae archaeon]
MKNRDSLLSLAKNEIEYNYLSFLIEVVEAGLNYAQPENLLSAKVSIIAKNLIVEGHEYSLSKFKRYYLIAFGKAAIPMTKWFLKHFPVVFNEIVVASLETKIDFDSNVTYFQCGHPYPNEGSIKAANYVLNLLSSLSKDDLCIMLISGGGSAILEKPAYKISLDDYNILVQKLLLCGAPIKEINTIRKHFSAVKGGRLAVSTKATIISLIMSDVIGDCISVIASGPTVPDLTTWRDVHNIFLKYDLYSALPRVFADIVDKGIKGTILDTPSEKDKFQHVRNYVIGSNNQLIRYLKRYILNAQFNAEIIDYPIQGEARDIGQQLAQKIKARVSSMSKSQQEKPCLFLSGGETTVTIVETSNCGYGGRNQELALSFAISSKDLMKCFFVSFGTDGIDGNSKAAGALFTSHAFESSEVQSEAILCLETHDSNSFFKKYGGEIITGLTGTNLMDVIICLVPRGA